MAGLILTMFSLLQQRVKNGKPLHIWLTKTFALLAVLSSVWYSPCPYFQQLLLLDHWFVSTLIQAVQRGSEQLELRF